MSFGKRALSALGRLGIIIAIAIAFLFGLAGSIYLSFRTSEVKVPEIVGKDYLTAEKILEEAGLNVRKRATRPSADQPNIVLDQLPRAGVIVKAGQTVAVDVSRAPKEGEYVPASTTAPQPDTGQKNENQNSNESTVAKNQNGNQNTNNQNQNKKPKNTNKNANNANNKNANNSNNKNANNSNNANNTNANRNANNRNAGNRNATNGNNTNNRNANSNRNANANGNRNTTNLNTNRRAPVPTTPPFNPGSNGRTP